MIQDFIHDLGLTPSQKLIYDYIYDHLKTGHVKSVIIPTPTLAKIGGVGEKRASAITREIEQMGLVNRKIDGHKVEYSLPTPEIQYVKVPSLDEAELEYLNIIDEY